MSFTASVGFLALTGSEVNNILLLGEFTELLGREATTITNTSMKIEAMPLVSAHTRMPV